MSRCDIKINMEGQNQEQRAKHWGNILIDGNCPDCGMRREAERVEHEEMAEEIEKADRDRENSKIVGSSDNKYGNLSLDDDIFEKKELEFEQAGE